MTAHNTIEFGAATWKHGFTIVPNHVLDSERLSGNAKLTFALLMRFGRTKEAAYPGQKRMAEAVGCTEKTLRVYIEELTDNGLVEVRRRGRGLTNLYVLHPDREILPIQSGNDDPSRTVTTTDKEEQVEKEQDKTDDAAASGRASEIELLYETYWRRVMGGDPKPCPPSLQKIADKALNEFSVEQLCGPAIEGFLAWRRKKPGDRRFSTIFASHFRGRPLHDHIEFWISQAGDSSALTGLPSETQVKIHRAVRDVQRGHRSQDDDLVQQAQQAKEWLEGQGIAMVPRESDGYPTFPSLSGGR